MFDTLALVQLVRHRVDWTPVAKVAVTRLAAPVAGIFEVQPIAITLEIESYEEMCQKFYIALKVPHRRSKFFKGGGSIRNIRFARTRSFPDGRSQQPAEITCPSHGESRDVNLADQ